MYVQPFALLLRWSELYQVRACVHSLGTPLDCEPHLREAVDLGEPVLMLPCPRFRRHQVFTAAQVRPSALPA